MDKTSITLGVIIFLVVTIVIGGTLWGAPKYKVYKSDLSGQANLRQQEWEKKIAVEEAKALKESATLKADAEVERAKGVAEANEIIAGSLKGNEAYLRYLWIDNIRGENQVIYVPTEAGLPILEAGKR